MNVAGNKQGKFIYENLSKNAKTRTLINMGKEMLTEPERHRLIRENMVAAHQWAQKFWTHGNIPIDELEAEAMKALVMAARGWNQSGTFAAYSDKTIQFALLKFIDRWENLVEFEDGVISEKSIYEWQNGFFALYEQWEGDPPSPESLLNRYQDIAEKQKLIAAAFAELENGEREIVHAYFIMQPRRSLDTIAREFRISYMNTAKIVERAVKKMAETITRIEKKKREENIIPFPTRAGRLQQKSDRPNIARRARPSR